MYRAVAEGKRGNERCSSAVALFLCELVDGRRLWSIVVADFAVYKCVS